MSADPRPLENDIKREAIKLLESHRIQVFRRNTGAFSGTHNGKRRFVKFSEPGQSDLWGILPDGRHLEVELKRLKERPTYEQALWLVKCSVRCPAFWADNLRTLNNVIQAVLQGGQIVYRDELRRYGKNGWGPSGDYDVRFER